MAAAAQAALAASVYSERPLDPDEVVRVLRPYAGSDVGVEDAKEDTYAISGQHAVFYTAYWSPRLYTATLEPPALGAMRKGPLHHWDLNTGIHSGAARPELRQKVASGGAGAGHGGRRRGRGHVRLPVRGARGIAPGRRPGAPGGLSFRPGPGRLLSSPGPGYR